MSSFEPIAREAAETLLERLLAFRERDLSASAAAQDLSALLELFPRVSLRQGFVLDFVQETTDEGVKQPIRPFARPAGDDSWVPIFDDEPDREDLVEQLYQYLDHEPSPAGLFEYALFVIELWSMRMSRHAADWLESTPVFSESRFDRVLEEARKVNEVRRPEHFGPLARPHDDGGGRVRFLVYTPIGWERIYYLESMIFADGYVDHKAGEIVADMGSGLIF